MKNLAREVSDFLLVCSKGTQELAASEMSADISKLGLDATLKPCPTEERWTDHRWSHLLCEFGSMDSVREYRHFATPFAPALVRRNHARLVKM